MKSSNFSSKTKISYQKLYEALFDEITSFLYENLTPPEQERLILSLQRLVSDEEKINLIVSEVKRLDKKGLKISQRLSKIINQSG